MEIETDNGNEKLNDNSNLPKVKVARHTAFNTLNMLVLFEIKDENLEEALMDILKNPNE